MGLIKTKIFRQFHSFFLQHFQKPVNINLKLSHQKILFRRHLFKKKKEFRNGSFLKNLRKNKNKNTNFCRKFVKINIQSFKKI